MPFLFAIAVLTWVHAIAVYKSLHARQSVGWLHWLALVAFSIPFAEMIWSLSARDGFADERNWFPPALLIFGLMTTALYGWKFYSLYKVGGDRSRAGWRGGISASCVVLGLYVSGAALDHLMFFRKGQLSGFADARSLGVADVDCEIAVVRLQEDGADYRCPHSVVLGMESAAPFAPWPSYTSGHSVQLPKALADFRQRARAREAAAQ